MTFSDFAELVDQAFAVAGLTGYTWGHFFWKAGGLNPLYVLGRRQSRSTEMKQFHCEIEQVRSLPFGLFGCRNEMIAHHIYRFMPADNSRPRGMACELNEPRGPSRELNQTGDQTPKGLGPTIGARGRERGDARREGGGRDDDRGSVGGYSNTGNNPGNPKAGGYHSGGTTTGGGYSNTGNNPGNPNAGGYHGGGTTLGNSNGTGSSSHDHTATEGRRPILLDLDGDGIEITELSKSTVFTDTLGDGLDHRTAWAGAGDGVLFLDADGNGQLSNSHELVFTEWADGARDDLDALRRAFDSNGDGKLTSADARWGEFRVQVTKADGSQEVKTLGELGITELDLTADATEILLPDGSAITGQSSFVMNGVTRVLANTRLMAETQGYRVEEVVATAANGTRTVTQSGYDQTGDRVFVVTSVTSANWLSITNRFDQDGDGVVDRLQSLQTVLNANGSRTETVFKRQGNRKDSPSRGRLDETLPRDLGRIVIPAFQRLRRGCSI